MEKKVYERHIKNQKTHWWFSVRRELISKFLKKYSIKKNLKTHGKDIIPYPEEEEKEEEDNFQSSWPARKTNTHPQLRLARSHERNETISRFGAHLKTHKPRTSDKTTRWVIRRFGVGGPGAQTN